MKDFFWRLVGADCYILSRSSYKSQKAFLMLGMLYAFLTTLTFISFFGLFLGVFKGYILSFFGAAIFTFIISNMYRLVIISLEPSTLPVLIEYKTKFWAYLIRTVIVILLAAFISKVIETMFFGHWVDEIIEAETRKNVGELNVKLFDKSTYFVRHIIKLNIHYPLINILTFIIISLYILPIIIKHKLKRGNQYYQLKRIIDTKIVIDEYKRMLKVKKDVLSEVCMSNGRLYNYTPKYHDEPFNTKKIKKEKENGMNHDDFLKLFD